MADNQSQAPNSLNPLQILESRISIRPLMNNYFYVSVFGRHQDNFGTGGAIDLPYVKCTKVDLPAGLKLNYHEKVGANEGGSFYRKFIKSASRGSEKVTFTWLEDSQLHIWSYHQAWIRRFYNPSTDSFVCGPEGKLRVAVIDVYENLLDPEAAKNEQGQSGSSINIDIKTYAVHRFVIDGLQPIEISQNLLNFDSSRVAEVGEVKYEYYYDNVYYQYLVPNNDAKDNPFLATQYQANDIYDAKTMDSKKARTTIFQEKTKKEGKGLRIY